MLGDSKVGKTSLMAKYVDKEFDIDVGETVAVCMFVMSHCTVAVVRHAKPQSSQS